MHSAYFTIAVVFFFSFAANDFHNRDVIVCKMLMQRNVRTIKKTQIFLILTIKIVGLCFSSFVFGLFFVDQYLPIEYSCVSFENPFGTVDCVPT